MRLSRPQLPLLSIVAPAYDEADALPLFHEQLTRVLDTLREDFSYEVVYVDDGSTDETPAALARFAREDHRVRYLRLSRNFGHQAALTAGLVHARGEIIISMDTDGQHPPAVIRSLLARWREGYPVVVTLREDHHSLGWFKKLSSRLFYWAMRHCSGMDIRPAAADFRLLTRAPLDALLKLPERHRFLRGMVHWLGFPTAEVTFDAPPRFAGKSKFTLVRMVRLARDGLLSFSRVPLHAAIILAFGLIVASFIGCSSIWLACRPAESWGWLLLAGIVGTHAVAGGLWALLFAVCEYLARIHEQVLNRPLYVIERTSDDDAVVAGKPRVAA
ncbi:glycosyltransferase family 2 protein [Zavarzinella formosa]|uniref:glycosyltransferase family 2 protein n=1 Tax=Zavarzinella formosa TaxID=360055 RepID=UPI00031678CB|nr:glycosyltransferase family 2 protein [Zavarzinella formosa]